jgi:hypothetical protein
MNALILTALVIGGVIMPTDRLTVTPWGGGLVVDAPTHLAGQYFYEAERVTVRMGDGSSVEYVIEDRLAYAPAYEWEDFLQEHATAGGLVLITCYPRESVTAWMMVTFMVPVGNVSGAGTISEPAVAKPRYCRNMIVGGIKHL